MMTMGFTVSVHYCGDVVESVSIQKFNAKEEPADCCSEMSDDGCCKTEINTIHLDDDFCFQAKYESNSYEISFINIPTSSIDYITTWFLNSDVNNTSPPHHPDICILNSTFLI